MWTVFWGKVDDPKIMKVNDIKRMKVKGPFNFILIGSHLPKVCQLNFCEVAMAMNP